MNDFYRIYTRIKKHKDKRFALATIVRVDGSAYRREGAKMLFGEDGSRYGTISAGCLEEDLSCQAEEVLDTLQPKSVRYDLRSVDDLSWGQSAGCDGDIEVYVEPVHWEPDGLWPCIERTLEEGKRVLSAKCVGGKGTRGTRFLYSEAGEVLGGAGDSHVQTQLNPYLKSFAASGQTTKLFHVPDLDSDFLFELYTPKDPLYVFGAGPDAEPLVQLASQADFTVTVIDPRSSRCNAEHFPAADFRIVEHPEAYLAAAHLPAHSYVLVMTHNFNRDQTIVQQLLETPPYYLGVLGPKRRTERLLPDRPLPEFLHSPIGLPIGAVGPEEISISVVAELIQARHHADQQERHSPAACSAYAKAGVNL